MRDLPNPRSMLVQLRLKHGLSQRALSEALDTSEQTVRNWEQGKTVPRLTIPQSKKLCILLNCAIHDLPDWFGPPETIPENWEEEKQENSTH